jgi:nuclear GTP-binding protein
MSSDLVPKSNAQAWLKHLRHTTPTLPFLSPSSSQYQRTNISSTTAPALHKHLKAYKPKVGTITIGVVGYPNVGKSSLINSLKRSKVCAVAAQAGHTKELQSVQLERGMKIVDSPGVVFDDEDELAGGGVGGKKGSVLLRNVVKVEDVEDPIAVGTSRPFLWLLTSPHFTLLSLLLPFYFYFIQRSLLISSSVEEILSRTSPETLKKIYDLPPHSNTLEFLTMLALASGRLLKGGTPDIVGAARHILMDWNHQKIPYFSVPPEVHPSNLPAMSEWFTHSVLYIRVRNWLIVFSSYSPTLPQCRTPNSTWS